jgi:hypothetical protein
MLSYFFGFGSQQKYNNYYKKPKKCLCLKLYFKIILLEFCFLVFLKHGRISKKATGK